LASGGGRAGDLLITIALASHPLFEREGADLRLELPITLYEAVLGGKVRVPTLDGAVELAIPPGTSAGRTFRLKGKGFPAKEGGAGDLLATVRIVLPDRPDSELEALMRKWREGKPYDPRKNMAGRPLYRTRAAGILRPNPGRPPPPPPAKPRPFPSRHSFPP